MQTPGVPEAWGCWRPMWSWRLSAGCCMRAARQTLHALRGTARTTQPRPHAGENAPVTPIATSLCVVVDARSNRDSRFDDKVRPHSNAQGTTQSIILQVYIFTPERVPAERPPPPCEQPRVAWRAAWLMRARSWVLHHEPPLGPPGVHSMRPAAAVSHPQGSRCQMARPGASAAARRARAATDTARCFWLVHRPSCSSRRAAELARALQQEHVVHAGTA